MRTLLFVLLFLSASLADGSDAKHADIPEHYGAVEINHFDNAIGWHHCAIFRDQAGWIQAWRWANVLTRPVRLPSGRYLYVFDDTGVPRMLTADFAYETVTDFDVEMFDRNRFPWQQRTGLFTPSRLRRVLTSDVPPGTWVAGQQHGRAGPARQDVRDLP